jgi:hypothetical protein
MNRDILNIILNDVLYNDINSIKKTSLISKNIHNNIQILAQTNEIKNKLNILQKYIYINKCMSNAALCGHIDIVQLMIGKGVQRSMNWNRVMSNAAEGGHMNIVQLMIEKGATDWNWAMSSAARGGHMNIVQLMIEKGANWWNETMCDAALYGHINIVQLMIEKGGQRSIDWNGAMGYAVCGGHMNIVQLLIEKSGERFNWAIGHAEHWRETDIVELLKQHQSKKFD